jgi:hypothetical protein
MAQERPFVEHCTCGHTRHDHADRDNRLQVVPLSMTEADDEVSEDERPTTMVLGAGACRVAGCGCTQFTAAPD